ncbi:MAG: hypothetical protein RLY31_1640 [Bacteroidota bacterium]|jgi:DNA-binding LytR/AlgR family response regulator
MINTLIVDDEPLALDVMETYLEKMPEIRLVRRCGNAFEALQALQQEDIDLVFLDIQMPQLTGIDLLRTLSDPPLVIFTTAYPNYAIEGFELNATDYLLKPISLERFVKAVNKATEQIERRRRENAHEMHLVDAEDFIFVKSDKRFVKVKFSEVVYIEGLKDYVIIRTEKGRIITLQTMKSLEEKLPQRLFRRIHRSFMVNIDKVEAILGNMVEVVEKGQPKHLPIGKNYRDDLSDLINDNRL